MKMILILDHVGFYWIKLVVYWLGLISSKTRKKWTKVADTSSPLWNTQKSHQRNEREHIEKEGKKGVEGENEGLYSDNDDDNTWRRRVSRFTVTTTTTHKMRARRWKMCFFMGGISFIILRLPGKWHPIWKEWRKDSNVEVFVLVETNRVTRDMVRREKKE